VRILCQTKLQIHLKTKTLPLFVLFSIDNGELVMLGLATKDAPEIPNSAGYIFDKTKVLLAGLAPPIPLPSALIPHGEPYAGNRLDECPAPALVNQWLSKVMGLPAVTASAPACGKKTHIFCAILY
jgi:hypothetical protein